VPTRAHIVSVDNVDTGYINAKYMAIDTNGDFVGAMPVLTVTCYPGPGNGETGAELLDRLADQVRVDLADSTIEVFFLGDATAR
jgi:hypothetical protein